MNLEAFSQVCDVLPEPTLLVGTDCTILRANRAAIAEFALAEPVEGLPLGSIVADSSEHLKELVRRWSRNRELVPGALSLRRGEEHVEKYRVSGCRLAAGDPGILIVRAADTRTASGFRLLNERIQHLNAEIHFRRQVEAELQAQREWLRTMLTSMGDGVIATDTHSRVTLLNPVAEQLTGWTEAEARGLPVQQVFHIVNEETRELVANPVTRVLECGQIVGLANHTVLISRDGSETPIDDSGAPIRDGNGEITGAVLVFRDVSDKKKAEKDLRASFQELQRLNGELEEFAYVAAHDIQEPLRMVKTYTQLLLRRFAGNPDPDIALWTRFIQSGSDRATALVRDLLAYMRASHEGDAPAPVSSDVASELRDALLLLEQNIAAAQGSVEMTELPFVPCRPLQFTVVFQNLISNAIKYRRPEEPLRIEIASERRDGRWVFSVRDNGIGFDQQYASRIFGLFKRLHSRSDIEGTGLGLAIVRRIVERSNGEVWAESVPGKGSTFYFSLPVPPAAD